MFSDVGLSITVLSIMKLKKTNNKKKTYIERIQNDLALPSAWPICCYFFPPTGKMLDNIST